MVDKTDFGVALAEMRQKRGLAQRDLSALAGMPDSAIGQYESGHRPNPGRRTVERIAAGLQASRAELEDLLRAAGRLKAGELLGNPDRPSMEVFLRGDPDLTEEQREVLLGTYRMFVRSNRGR